ncbi:FtsX-like permease family protein [Actinoallomurus sp. CA-150999]|uniref:FtsX-like permease family protein n=1 Tax=Actinoallomurus sp. CA-150999 TaxID=3239887 RepID=UPI003D8E77A8
MFALALRSLRRRAGAFTATFLAIFLGATILMAFASLLDTSLGEGVSSANRETLVTMANVVGGWGLLIVIFAVASTLTLSVRQRGTELALLKSIGATPAQIRRMIVGEAAVVAVIAAASAIPLALLAGHGLFAMLVHTHQLAPNVEYVFGPIALSMGLGITFVAATAAATLAARRATRVRAAEAMTEATTEPGRMTKKRIVAACVFLALGVYLAVLTVTVMRDKATDAMSTAGSADGLAAIGFALLGPALIRKVIAIAAVPLERLGGASGHLAVQNLRRRSNQMATALMPIILFTGISVGTLCMQSTENAVTATAGVAKTADQKNIETLNLVVIAMIALFAAIMLINTLVAATTHRRREFAQQRLAGATPVQVLRVVALESTVLTATGVLFGAIASLFTSIAYSNARADTFLPNSGAGIFLGMVTLAAVLTFTASLGTARRTIRTPAIDAVTA